MQNTTKIRVLSRALGAVLSVAMVAAPLYYVLYWAFINQLPQTPITINMDSLPIVARDLSLPLRLVGFLACLFPLASLLFVFRNLRRLFRHYSDGIIFSFEHVQLFRNTATALLLWVLLSVLYGGAKSVLFSIGGPPGTGVLSLTIEPGQMTTVLVALLVFIVAWVMDHGRALAEDARLTI